MEGLVLLTLDLNTYRTFGRSTRHPKDWFDQKYFSRHGLAPIHHSPHTRKEETLQKNVSVERCVVTGAETGSRGILYLVESTRTYDEWDTYSQVSEVACSYK